MWCLMRGIKGEPPRLVSSSVFRRTHASFSPGFAFVFFSSSAGVLGPLRLKPANKKQSGHFTALRGKEELNRTLGLVTFFRVRAIQKAFIFSGSGGAGETPLIKRWIYQSFWPRGQLKIHSHPKSQPPFRTIASAPKEDPIPDSLRFSGARHACMSLAGSYTWRSSAVQLLDQLAANARRVEQIGRRVL